MCSKPHLPALQSMQLVAGRWVISRVTICSTCHVMEIEFWVLLYWKSTEVLTGKMWYKERNIGFRVNWTWKAPAPLRDHIVKWVRAGLNPSFTIYSVSKMG